MQTCTVARNTHLVLPLFVLQFIHPLAALLLLSLQLESPQLRHLLLSLVVIQLPRQVAEVVLTALITEIIELEHIS